MLHGCMGETQIHTRTPKEGGTSQLNQPLDAQVLGILSEDDYRRYASLEFKGNAIEKLRLFAPNSPELAARQEMLAGFEKLCAAVACSQYPLKAAYDFVIQLSPLAQQHREQPNTKTLLAHLREVSEFAREFLLDNGTISRFPRLLTDREALLITYVAAPLHDLTKYLGTPQAQIMPDHEIMAAELVRRHFEEKRLALPNGAEIIFTSHDCTFLSSLIGDHENIEKEAGRTDFISSHSSIERAKALFSVLDTLTGVLKREGPQPTWACDRLQLDERFTDLVYRHIDLVKGKIFRPAWASLTIKDLSHTVDHLSKHGVFVSGTTPGESFQQALARSGLRAIERTLDDEKARCNLPHPQKLFTNKQLGEIEAARAELQLLL